MKKIKSKKSKKMNAPLILVSAFAIALISIIMIVFLVVLTQFGKNGAGNPNLPVQDDLTKTNNFSDYFPGCDLINGECLDASCDKYFLCNDKKYSVCEIYDCKEEFGIGTKDENGEIDIRRKIKDERKKIAEIKNRCDGTLKILKSDCVEEKLEIQTQVSTAGDCAIEGFMAVYEVGEDESKKSFKPAKFSDLGNGLYLVKTSNCNEILELIAIGEAGVSIK